MILGLTCGVVLLPVLALAVIPQPAPDTKNDEDVLVLHFDEMDGVLLTDFLKMCAEVIGAPITYDARSMRDQIVPVTGRVEVPRERLWAFLHEQLASAKCVMFCEGVEPIVAGPRSDSKAARFHVVSCEPRGGVVTGLRVRSPLIPAERLEEFRDAGSFLLTTVFPVEHARAPELANMLQIYFSDPLLESVRAVPPSNVLVATGRAATLRKIRELVAECDVAPEDRMPARFELLHLPAESAAAQLEDYLKDRWEGEGPAFSRVPAEVSPIVAPNVLLVHGTAAEIELARGWVANADVPPARDVITRVHRLAHASAARLAGPLCEWAAGQAYVPRVRLVPEPASNSLIVTAPADGHAALAAFLADLDVAPR